MACRKPEATTWRSALISFLGATVIFAFTASRAEAQHGGLSRGGGGVVPGSAHRGGGSGTGGWTNRGGTWSFYTYSHGPRGKNGFRSGRTGGFNYAPVAPVLPYYPLPLLDYGLNGFSLDMNDSGWEYPTSEAPPSPGPNPAATAMEMNQAAMAHQIEELHQEVEDLKSSQAPPPSTAAVPPKAATSGPPQTPITLVLRDGKQIQADDYAVMDGTFWDFSSRPVRKIPLSSIDFAASRQATEASGGEFPAITNSR